MKRSNGGSIWVSILTVVVGVFAVVGVWYFFAVGLPSYYQQKAIDNSAVASSTASSTMSHQSNASTTFFGGVVKTASTTSDVLNQLLYPNALVSSYSTSTISLIGIVESSSQPLTNLLTDSHYASGLSNDVYFTIQILESWPSKMPQFADVATPVGRALNNQYIDIIAGNSYVSEFKILPGNLVMAQITDCGLYSAWPGFICTQNITPSQQWTISNNDLSVTWQGQNGAALSLTGGTLDTFASNSVLTFQVNATSGYGEFCPSSLLTAGPTLLENENGAELSPILALPSICTGPNTNSMATTYLPFWTTTSTPFTINVIGSGPTGTSSQTFFDLYPLPDGQLFLLNASTSAVGQ